MTHNRDTIDGLREFAESLKSGDLSQYRIAKVTIDESGNYVRRVLEPAERTSTDQTDTDKETATVSINYDDPTPLSELTGEQWREMGATFFVDVYGGFDSWQVLDGFASYSVVNDVLYVDDRHIAKPTLGKLRHLIAALS